MQENEIAEIVKRAEEYYISVLRDLNRALITLLTEWRDDYARTPIRRNLWARTQYILGHMCEAINAIKDALKEIEELRQHKL